MEGELTLTEAVALTLPTDCRDLGGARPLGHEETVAFNGDDLGVAGRPFDRHSNRVAIGIHAWWH